MSDAPMVCSGGVCVPADMAVIAHMQGKPHDPDECRVCREMNGEAS